MVGLRPGSFDARNIRQIGQNRSWLEFSDKLWEASSVVQKDRRGRRFDHDISARHGLEELRPDDALHGRKSSLKGFRQTGYDVVSVDGKPLRTRFAVRGEKAYRQRQRGVHECACNAWLSR